MKTAAFFFTCILLASVFTSCASSFNTSTIDPDQPVQVAMVEYTAPYGIYVTGDGTSAQLYKLTRQSKLKGEVQSVSLSVLQDAIEKNIDSIAEIVKSKTGITLDINRLKDELGKSFDAPPEHIKSLLGNYDAYYNVHCIVLPRGGTYHLTVEDDVNISWQASPVDEIYAVIQFATDSSFNKTGKGGLVPTRFYFVKKDKKTGKVTGATKMINLQ